MGEDRQFVGARLDAGLYAARFVTPPSAEEFADDVEPKNVPAVILLPHVLPKFSLLPSGYVCCRVGKFASSGLSWRG